MKNILLGAFGVLLFTGCLSEKEHDNSVARTADLVIVQINDVYEIAGVNQGREGGLARVQGLVDSLKRTYPQVLLLHAGDFLNPSLIGNLRDSAGNRLKGKHMVDVMNAMEFDAVAFGNHEIDLKYGDLAQRLGEMQFDMISANVFHQMDSSRKPFFQNENEVQPYKTFEVTTSAGIKKLGVLSVTLPFNRKPYVHYTNVDSSVQYYLKELEQTTDDQVLLTHLERVQDQELAKQVNGVRLIMGGHDHYSFCDTINTAYITKADANARTAWVHFLTWNKSDQQFDVVSELIAIDETIAKNKAVARVVEQWTQFALEATKEDGFDMDAIIYQCRDTLNAKEEEIRSKQTNFGRLVTSSMIYGAENATIAVLNSGSIRYDDWLTGDLTEGDILKALPFGGGIKQTEMSYDAVQRMLQVGRTNKGTGGYLQVYMQDSLMPGKNYQVVTSSFVAAGKENNLEFLQAFDWKEPASMQGNGGDIRRLIINYLKQEAK